MGCPEGVGAPMSIGPWNKCDQICTNIIAVDLYQKNCQCLLDSNLDGVFIEKYRKNLYNSSM
jgi:hypothetical protein